MEVRILASDLPKKGDSRVESLDPNAVAGMHTGGGESINPKHWPCEDSLILSPLGEASYLAGVADAHWGGSSSEAVARGLLQAWKASERREATLSRLRDSLFRIESTYVASKAENDPSETTVLLVHLDGPQLNYVSVGDSLLIVISAEEGYKVRNLTGGYFMGRWPLKRKSLGGAVDSGRMYLSPGDLVLLASDGLEAEASALHPEDLTRELKREAPLRGRVERLLELASDPARGAGRDNLALVAIEISEASASGA